MTKLEKLGIKIGHYTNKDGITGATVIIPDKSVPAILYTLKKWRHVFLL